ncbi:hypothetical protein [Paraburkholderia sp. SIMBA_054]|uniref:hypothetical protein n=1 Tax=Paraburkholderia sp. SIMBA_054 TaxID=3085795 RepID=UPI00397893AA
MSEKTVRGFHHFASAFYASNSRPDRDCDDRVDFGLYQPGTGVGSGEMGMEWRTVSGEPMCPRMSVHGDAFALLEEFRDVMAALAAVDGERLSPKAFCDLLLRLGFQDFTARSPEDAAEIGCGSWRVGHHVKLYAPGHALHDVAGEIVGRGREAGHALIRFPSGEQREVNGKDLRPADGFKWPDHETFVQQKRAE